ncbi:FtsJ-like methyltransferase-domain-containing protein [Piptocephalis cylindrospora]|uniref:Cap-specific mRNA (nucleoside-2'-O-)-methyltransferase 1 n=1 Tax=Piptocephalis cylindrospora TaxID=1907219 RepID=A0A4P9Y6G5_9FUNG|nr:FtsJ-like methyltransferase-domain-containing protein [Piptocephalis cylindrospora]|eukprot:RKP14637.1 FtsJ-like methyltransferase-domain-containing protein [Piptocephalis cylindrospora]
MSETNMEARTLRKDHQVQGKTSAPSVSPVMSPSMLVTLKAELSDMEPSQLAKARAWANPAEGIGRLGFMNRAAVKMAELDAIFQLTVPPKECSRAKRPRMGEKSMFERSFSSGHLTFVDLCGGPGGFSEYILWRVRTSGDPVKGWGMTLRRLIEADRGTEREAPDFHLDSFREETNVRDSMNLIYGPDSTGDILDSKNRETLSMDVDRVTHGQGVHLVTADGAFDVVGHEALQEVLSGHLLLAQVHLGLSLLCLGGQFVCKFFDASTPLTKSLLYTMTKCFTTVELVKPMTSRPANSERYLVAREFLGMSHAMKDRMNRAMCSAGLGQDPVDAFSADPPPSSFSITLDKLNQW